MKKKPDLSIIIISYNTKNLILDCLKSLERVSGEIDFEVIIVDNRSTDGSQVGIRQFKSTNSKLAIKLIENEENIGFARGNNLAKKYCQSRYVLFLNPDTLVHKRVLIKTLEYLKSHEKVGVVTCKMKLPQGGLDIDARRSFPTPWVSFTHMVIPLDRMFPKSKVFAKYWYGYLPEDKVHEIDVAQGAFFLTRKKVLDQVGWFDEDYFLDGEDIDLCFRIKEVGWKIVYYPRVAITHVKKASKRSPRKSDRRKIVSAGVDSMELFYRKRLWDRYPAIINISVVIGIKVVKLIRAMKLFVVTS